MLDKPSHQGLAESRKFIPQVKPLESRLLLSHSQTVSFPDGASVVFPTFNRLPRTGGVFAQTGSLLNIGVGQSTTNNVHVTDDSSGDVTAEWNGAPAHMLTGVDSTVIQLQKAGRDQVTINLTGPRTGPAGVAVASLVPTDAASASGHADLAAMTTRRTSGVAVQSGSVLTVTVSALKTNSVEISNEGAGAVLVEWNGGAVHSFTGVETIVVDTRNARNNLVALHDATG
jgi:hypothetical protein